MWRQAYEQASRELLLAHAGEFTGSFSPSFSWLGNAATLAENLGTDRPTAARLRQELLDRTRVWYREYSRQLAEARPSGGS